MSLATPQLVGALAMAQATAVAPALEGHYAGGSASTIAACLMLVAQDLSRPQTAPAEWAAIDARLREIDADPAHAVETRTLLDRLVVLTEAAVLRMPG